MATPQQITGVKITDLRYDIEVNIDDAIRNLTQAKEEALGNGYTNLYISVDVYDDYGSSAADIELKGSRMETMEEAILRESAAIRHRQFAEQREREQYEALKKKFGS